jgi:hypothetical protein
MNNKNIKFCNFFINNKSKISSKSLVTIQRLFFKKLYLEILFYILEILINTHTHTQKKISNQKMVQLFF